MLIASTIQMYKRLKRTLILVIIKVFMQCKIMSGETVLSAFNTRNTNFHHRLLFFQARDQQVNDEKQNLSTYFEQFYLYLGWKVSAYDEKW